MTAKPASLIPNPVLPPVEDFYALRREGVGYIAEAGSREWTDFNVHDPGITLLEALCYAITDIGYRTGWNIADLLTGATPSDDPKQPFPDQSFFTARDILTVNPTTSEDARKLLIDLPLVRNAWLICKACACETSYFAWCTIADELKLGYREPAASALIRGESVRESWAKGLFEVLIDLEEDAELGDLGDRMVVFNGVLHDADGAHAYSMELRFPDMALIDRDDWLAFLDNDAAFANEGSFTLELTRLAATKDYNILTPPGIAPDPDGYLRRNWNGLFYLDFAIDSASLAAPITIENAALRVIGDNAVRNAAKASDWQALFQNRSAGGILQRYRRKAKATRVAVESARDTLHAHRNLDEDYCYIASVGVEDVAVCADVDVTPDADIERVQAEIWLAIEEYFSPPIRFHTLRERLEAGAAVEDIFDGPALENGFIDADDLKASDLKTVLRCSDIIGRLMQINGVQAVNQLRLTKYDSEGAPVKGAADPTWSDVEPGTAEPSWAGGEPIFDPERLSATWLLYLASRSRPRLYLNLSRFLFFKNGLPFQPRMDEAMDTLNALRGAAERPKFPGAEKDLPVPKGEYRDPAAYFPVQHSLPLLYGVGPDGLPGNASAKRRAQALDLKSYLMVFEQMLGNALEQLAHSADLFSLDAGVARTRFIKAFSGEIIAGYETIAETGPAAAAEIDALAETQPQFLTRRNLFLDHLLARFGEQFSDYALLLTSIDGVAVARQKLIASKIAFLQSYPKISHDRYRAFNRMRGGGAADNDPGIKTRIGLLLGHPNLRFTQRVTGASGGNASVDFTLDDGGDKDWLTTSFSVPVGSEEAASNALRLVWLDRMIDPDAYAIIAVTGGFALQLMDGSANLLARSPAPFGTSAAAEAIRNQLLEWSAQARSILVEHLLLRPKFIGDALYPACNDGDCATCGSEDPYSFQLTYVMPGWTARYTGNLDLRRFADRTIQQETPSHLLPKICWVGNDGFAENPCDEVVGDLADLFAAEGQTQGGGGPSAEEACASALSIYHAFSAEFESWYADRKFAFLRRDALEAMIAAHFATAPTPADAEGPVVLSPALWTLVQAMMTAHFVDIAVNGWQFERFEWAWRHWLDADAAIDWTKEWLTERVEAVLTLNLTSIAQPGALCDCARRIVTDHGVAFHDWMEAGIAAGATLETLPPFSPPAVTLCSGMHFRADTDAAIGALLEDRYTAYRAPSYWLRVVVTLLAGLRNVYPGATLHDCDDGSDLNPVRLNNTALGNYPRRTVPRAPVNDEDQP
ncbi:hypothetical protein ACFOKF_21890 [Sphingobium rhizovicinum]|uniref:Insecticidal toxin complex protein n=1 Tax=Sphingobium rhizovicinum TaxID=432308 RepID=A0ABV7NL84_9SPHN